MGTAAQKGDDQGGIGAVRKLMIRQGIKDKSPELDKDSEIYEAVKNFLENTDFNPNLLPPHKY